MPQSKMMKAAVKRLKKLWPPKKKRKRLSVSSDWPDPDYRYDYLDLDLPPPPPPTFHRRCSCSYSYSSPSARPSAPPLPSWLDYPTPDPGSHDDLGSDAAMSYQQHTVPEPVYKAPLLPPATRKGRPVGRGSGSFFGCLSMFGINLIRCFCPCFHIRDEQKLSRLS